MSSPTASGPEVSDDLINQVSQLRSLLEAGKLTPEEFAAAKGIVLAELPGGPGAALPAPRALPEPAALPAASPATTTPTAAPPQGAASPSARETTNLWWVVGGVAVAVTVAVVVLAMLTTGWNTSTTGSGTAASPSQPQPPASGASGGAGRGPWSAKQVLTDVKATDRAAVAQLVGSWVPQISSKREGSAGADAVLSDHQQWRYTYPDVLLLWSGDYSSYGPDDYWVTIVGRPYGSVAAANSWCASAGRSRNDCYAKFVSHTVGPTGTSVMR